VSHVRYPYAVANVAELGLEAVIRHWNPWPCVRAYVCVLVLARGRGPSLYLYPVHSPAYIRDHSRNHRLSVWGARDGASPSPVALGCETVVARERIMHNAECGVNSKQGSDRRM
jgi:hypothetical protein